MGPVQNTTNYNWTDTSQWGQISAGYAVPDNQSLQGYHNNSTSYSQQSVFGESRKDMIVRLYRSILGREPDEAGLNYYLNRTYISELQIIKDMIESTEHVDILKKAKDVRLMLQKTEEAVNRANFLENQLNSLQGQISTLQTINESYRSLIEQQKSQINELRASTQVLQPTQTPPANQQNNDPVLHQEGQNINLGYMLPDPFEDDKETRSGCIGWIKKWFKFD